MSNSEKSFPRFSTCPELRSVKTVANSHLPGYPSDLHRSPDSPLDQNSSILASRMSMNREMTSSSAQVKGHQRHRNAFRDRLRLISAFWIFFTCGWGDGVTGTLLPDFQASFHLSYMSVSLLFVANTAGFATGTSLIDLMRRLLGRFDTDSECQCSLRILPSYLQKINIRSILRSSDNQAEHSHSHSQSRLSMLTLASILHACFFIIMGNSRGLAYILAAYFVSAFSRSFLTATVNAYIASTPRKPLGQLHACWGFGAFAAPLVCQSIVAKGVAFERFYLGSLVLSAINASLILLAFHPSREEITAERQEALRLSGCSSPTPCVSLSELKSTSDKGTVPTGSDVEKAALQSDLPTITISKPLKAVLSIPLVWAFCLFAWVYSGSETTTQAYIVTYLLTTRHSNPKTTGYVTSGFWAGMCISRLTWGIFSIRLSYAHRKYIIHVLIGIALTMHLTIWFVNSVIENAVASSIVGLVYGPIFPGTLGLATDLLERDAHLLSMAIISAFANLGSSIFPFITGTLANVYSPRILPYVTVSQAGTLLVLWFFFPSRGSSHPGTNHG